MNNNDTNDTNDTNVDMDIVMMNYILDSIQNRKGVFIYSDPHHGVHISNIYYDTTNCLDYDSSICESNNYVNYEEVQLFDLHEMKKNNYNEIVLAMLFLFTFSLLVFLKI